MVGFPPGRNDAQAVFICVSASCRFWERPCRYSTAWAVRPFGPAFAIPRRAEKRPPDQPGGRN